MRYPIGFGEIALAFALVFFKHKLLVVYAIYGWAVVALITHLQAGQTKMLGGEIAFVILNCLLWWSWKPVSVMLMGFLIFFILIARNVLY